MFFVQLLAHRVQEFNSVSLTILRKSFLFSRKNSKLFYAKPISRELSTYFANEELFSVYDETGEK